MAYMGKRGAVLIVVLGVLAILALLATTFATLQITERQIARNYLDTVRAKLLAMSGVEDATARLKDAFPFRAFDPSPAAAKAWVYYGAETDRYNKVPIPTPIEKAVNPSFAHENEAVQDPTVPNLPQNLTVEGQARGFSGVMGSGIYGQFTEHYALKVSDLSSHIYVNDGLDGGPGGGVSQNLKRILNILGQIKPAVDVPGLGDKILAARPALGYHHIDEILAALGYDKAAFGRVREFVTVQAWVDPNVANPVPLSPALVDYEKSQGNPMPENYGKVRGGLYRFMHSKDAAGNEIVPANGLNTCPPIVPAADPSQMAAACVYGLDTLNPQWIEIVSRAPVNVNAAPREVLIALLSDLKGFFLTDRRRNNPRYSGFGTGTVIARQNSHSPAMTEGDEIGYLVQTKPILFPNGTKVAGEIYADTLADHLIACRDKKIFGGFDYGAVPWGGLFRNWTQFNLFVDNLVATGVLQDTRPVFTDYRLDNAFAVVSGAGYSSTLVPSPVQRKHAAQAIADVLKANFNPNLHLNETNPDANLHTIVDKTDLLVNSTEFCFLSTGRFEIESLGRVLRPKTGTDARAADNELIAQAKVTAVVRLYELSRETTQKQFTGGALASQAGGGLGTNNNKSVEIGPEPESVKAGGENEWSGYLALPTVGGALHAGGNGSQLGEAMHVHFNPSFDSHYHVANPQEIAGRTLANEAVMNYPDLPGLPSGPYAPTDSAGNEHRLARSFRVTPGNTLPALQPAAPLDLRIDGGYSERHSGAAYATTSGGAKVWDFRNGVQRGTVSFWMKPSYDPERTGKMRATWDLSRYHDYCFNSIHVYPFAMWFLPSHNNASNWETDWPMYAVAVPDLPPPPSNAIESLAQLYSCSFAFGSVSYHVSDSTKGHSFGKMTRSLNHGGHPDESTQPSLFRGRHWTHVTFSWNLENGLLDEYWYRPHQSWMFVDGIPVDPYVDGGFDSFVAFESDSTMLCFDRHDDGAYGTPGTGDYNHMRLGSVSRIAAAAVTQLGQDDIPNDIFPGAYRGNTSADCTHDELHAWRQSIGGSAGANPSLANILWRRGRYYKPTGGEGVFTSQALGLSSGAGRLLAPPTSVAPPGPGLPIPPTPVTTVPPAIRILGLSWTWYGETTDAVGNRVLYDYKAPDVLPYPDVQPKVKLAVEDPNVPLVFYDNDGFSAVKAADGSIPALQNPQQVKYRAQFVLEKADPLNTILLATPVLDDVTVYWDEGVAVPISYVFDTRGF